VKANIHPEWFPEAQVTCACGNTFKVGSTLPKIEVEVCYNCHPFYTGQMKYVDTAGRVDSFEARRKMAVEEREKNVEAGKKDSKRTRTTGYISRASKDI